jgi:hypothetical protein
MKYLFILKRTIHYRFSPKYINVKSWSYAKALAEAEWERWRKR